MTFIEIIFGWPAVFASIVLTSAGIAIRSWMVALVGAIIAAPFMLYLFGTPRFMLVVVPVAAAGGESQDLSIFQLLIRTFLAF